MAICRDHSISVETFHSKQQEVRPLVVERAAKAASVERREREAEASGVRSEPGLPNTPWTCVSLLLSTLNDVYDAASHRPRSQAAC